MEKELDPEIIKNTQSSLGKYVKRPPLTEKLLKKPPFRFLHDVVTTVLKTTGFFENLFDDEELISDNVKDRDSKILFLNKVIYVINSTTGKSLSVKPSKVISGQEPEKTNELLQCLAQALDDKLSSEKAVQQYKESLNTNQINESKIKESSKPLKKVTDTKKLTSRSTEKLTVQKAIKPDKEKSNDVKARRKENISTKSEIQNKKLPQTKTVVKNNLKEQKDTQRRSKNIKPTNVEKEKVSNIVDKEKIPTISKLSSQDADASMEENNPEKININNVDSPITKENNEENLNSSYTILENAVNSSSSSNNILNSPPIKASENTPPENNVKDTSLAENYQTTADRNDSPHLKSLEIDSDVADKLKSNSTVVEKDFPRVEKVEKIVYAEKPEKNKGTEKPDSFNIMKTATDGNDVKNSRPMSVRPSSVRPSSSRPGAPRMREKLDNVIKDADNLLIGKVNIIAENTQIEEEDDSSLIIVDQAEVSAVSQDQQDVELSSSEHGHLVQQILDSQKQLTQISGKTEIEWQFGAQKAREAVNQDIEQLRFSIQALSRAANPLGKLLDHIQEDVEVMRQELQQWSNIYEDVNKDVIKQKAINEESLMPFHTKLKQLEEDIHEKYDKINDLKILIHKNANRIEKLLNSGNVQ